VKDVNILVDFYGLLVFAGNSTNPKPLRVPQDVTPDENGIIKSQIGVKWPQGKSSFDTIENMAKVLKDTTVHETIGDVVMPDGLTIKADGIDVGGPMSQGHHTIYNTQDMNINEFNNKLSQIETQPIGKIDKNAKFKPNGCH
jgi:hypothetical protein